MATLRLSTPPCLHNDYGDDLAEANTFQSGLPPTTRTRSKGQRKVVGAALLTIVLTAGASGCSSSSKSLALPQTEAASGAAAEEASPNDKDGVSGGATPNGETPIEQPAFPTARKQIKIATLSIEVPTERWASASSRITLLPTSFGGFVASSEQANDPGYDSNSATRFLTVVMRVPADRFDDARSGITGLGKLVSQKLSGQDVSTQLVDIEARLTTLKLQEEAYRKLFEKAIKIEDVIAVQDRLTAVRTEIEQIAAQKASLNDQVSYSTITVEMREVVTGKSPQNSKSLGNKLSSAWRAAIRALSNVLTALAVAIVFLVPFLPLIILGGLVVMFLRRVLARRAAKIAARPKPQQQFPPQGFPPGTYPPNQGQYLQGQYLQSPYLQGPPGNGQTPPPGNGQTPPSGYVEQTQAQTTMATPSESAVPSNESIRTPTNQLTGSVDISTDNPEDRPSN
jgi:Domain of unknown function (DUF4349)